MLFFSSRVIEPESKCQGKVNLQWTSLLVQSLRVLQGGSLLSFLCQSTRYTLKPCLWQEWQIGFVFYANTGRSYMASGGLGSSESKAVSGSAGEPCTVCRPVCQGHWRGYWWFLVCVLSSSAHGIKPSALHLGPLFDCPVLPSSFPCHKTPSETSLLTDPQTD